MCRKTCMERHDVPFVVYEICSMNFYEKERPAVVEMKKTETFETAIKRLEEIAGILESGQFELEKAIDLYAEGTKLINYCDNLLKKAEQKIFLLSQNGEFVENLPAEE